MPNLPESDPAVLLRERFLEGIATQLRGQMSPFEVDDTIREIRTHLVASSAAFEEVGLDSFESMRAAIQKFGQTERIEKELVRESRKSATRDNTLAVGLLMGAFAGGATMTFADAMIVAAHIVNNPSEGMPAIGAVMGMIIAGSLYRKPRHFVQAALRALWILPTTLNILVSLLNHGLMPPGLLVSSYLAYGAAAGFTAGVTAWAMQTFGRREKPIRSVHQ